MAEVYTVEVEATLIANWSMGISLKKEAAELLCEISGHILDLRWWVQDDQEDEFLKSTDTWGWTISHFRERMIVLWFKDPRHATYFKTLWGGV